MHMLIKDQLLIFSLRAALAALSILMLPRERGCETKDAKRFSRLWSALLCFHVARRVSGERPFYVKLNLKHKFNIDWNYENIVK